MEQPILVSIKKSVLELKFLIDKQGLGQMPCRIVKICVLQNLNAKQLHGELSIVSQGYKADYVMVYGKYRTHIYIYIYIVLFYVPLYYQKVS